MLTPSLRLILILFSLIVQRGAMDWTTEFRLLAGVRDFSLLRNVKTGSGTHPDSYPVGSAVSFPGLKAVGA
jgi:hypothetical protein